MANYTIFIGNPGTGKSTLLNGIIGKSIFRSGVSYGRGLTTVLQLQQADDGNFYGDTPGLADVQLRDKAAAEISKVLRSGEGNYKLVFVVTEEEGRVRPADGITMKLVLDALPKDREVPYGIIVNKLTKKKKQTLETDEEKFKVFSACLNEGRERPTAFIHLYQRIEELEDAEDEVHAPTSGLKQFLRILPLVPLKPEDVEDVRANEFDAQVEALEAELEGLRNDKKKLEEKMEKDRKKIQKQMGKLQKDQAEEITKSQKEREQLDKKLKEMEKSFKKDLEDAEKENGCSNGPLDPLSIIISAVVPFVKLFV